MDKIKWTLYLSAILFIAIPILIVIISDHSFSSVFSNSIIFIAILFVILGKIITIIEKKKVSKKFAADIGIIIGLCIVLLTRLA